MEDVTNATNCLQVLIFLRVEVVQWGGVTWFTIRHREVNSYGEIYLTATKDVLKECVLLLNLHIIQVEFASVFWNIVLRLALLHHGEGELSGAEIFVLSIGHWLEKLEFDRAFNIILAQVGRPDLYLVPADATTFGPLYLTFVDRSEVVVGDASIDNEEAEASFWELTNWVEHDDLTIGSGS